MNEDYVREFLENKEKEKFNGRASMWGWGQLLPIRSMIYRKKRSKLVVYTRFSEQNDFLLYIQNVVEQT